MRDPSQTRARAHIMKFRKLGASHLAVLLVAQVLWLAPSHSQAPTASTFRQEVSRQQDIYRSTGKDTPGGYVVTRGLTDYADVLPAAFDRDLANLGPGDRWLDIGAGEGQAILDYYTPEYDLAHAKGSERRGKTADGIEIVPVLCAMLFLSGLAIYLGGGLYALPDGVLGLGSSVPMLLVALMGFVLVAANVVARPLERS